MIHVLDLNFLGFEHAIAAFLIQTSEGPVLLETGPHSTFTVLRQQLALFGVKPEEIRHVFLSHIHLDHAGAAWALAQQGAAIYVHPIGAPHLADPSKLMESAGRIYGDQMDFLWGKMNSIPREQLKAVEDREEVHIGDYTFTSIHTPGHASHHIAWQVDDALFCGDVAGVKIGNGPVVPPCPPPDINLEDWNASIDKIQNLDIRTLYLTHFGPILHIPGHLQSLKEILNDWAGWVKGKWGSGMTAEQITPLFSEYTRQQLMKLGVDEHGVQQYEAANPSWMSVAGLIRYWKRKENR